MPSAQVSGSLVILLFIAGFVLLITQFGSGSSSSGSTGLASGASTASSAASAAAPASGTSGTSQGRYTGSNSEPSIFRVGANVRSLKFTVSQSGTSYHASTLAGQVRNQLNAQNGVTPAASAPNPTSSDGQVESSASSTAPAPANPTPSLSLKGCVSALTKGVTPSLVDQATYDGIPAYIIAVPSRVWVVRLGCTAAHPQEITSVSLPGLSGNLSALGSVEWYASPEERRME
jgi:hypothetical protein